MKAGETRGDFNDLLNEVVSFVKVLRFRYHRNLDYSAPVYEVEEEEGDDFMPGSSWGDLKIE